MAVIVNVLDHNRVQIDGPLSNVERQVINLKRLSLTDFTVDIQVGARQGVVAAAWKKANVTEQWEKTTWAQKRAAKARRGEMTDFDRFKLMKARKRRSHVINSETHRLLNAAKAEKK